MNRHGAVSLLAAALLLPSEASGFGTKRAHEELALSALEEADRDERIATYLRDGLGLHRGRAEPLAVQFGLDPRVDEDLITDFTNLRGIITRLNRSRSLDDEDDVGPAEYPFAPGDSLVFFDQSCRSAPDFDTCFAALERASVARLIAIGTYAEDNPNPRSRHHFHDPERAHGPTDNYGLDNSALFPGRVDDVLADFIAAGYRGGSWLRAVASFFGISSLANFELRGRSAIDRALNATRGGGLASDEFPENLFALPDAERYLYRAIAYPAKDERESYMALHFIALGHVLHLLQDMGSVAHVRNDFIVDHVLIDRLRPFLGTRSLESAGDDLSVFPSVLASVGSSLLNVPAREIILGAQGTVPSGFFDLHQEALDPTGFDTGDFWDRGPLGAPDDTDPSRAGLAERVHNRFLSAGTLSNTGFTGGYAKPNLPLWSLGFEVGTGQDAVRAEELPERDLETGVLTGVTGRYLASRLVPHLARCNYHCFYGAPIGFGYSVIDESVQRDYLELLFPLVIDYGAKFLQHYLAPRIEVVPTGPGEFSLRNLTALPFTADSDAVEIAYTAVDATRPEGHRALAEVSCDTSELALPPKPANGVAALGDFTCTLPAALPEAPLDTLDFWVVVRGQLGERGAVGTPSQYDTSIAPLDFVVAFDHVQPQLLFHRDVEDPLFQDDDRRHPIDLFSMPLDLGRSVQEDDVPPARENLTAALRAEIGAASLDLTAPNGEPSGVRIALRSDRDATEESSFFLDVAAPQKAFVFDPTKEPPDPAALVVLPESEHFIPSARAHVAPLWSADAAALFYYEDASLSRRETEDRLVRYGVASTAHAVFTDRIAYATSEPDETPAHLEPGTERKTCKGLESAAAASLDLVAGRTRCVDEFVEEVANPFPLPGTQRVWQETNRSSWEIRIGTVAESTDEPGKLEVEYTDRVQLGAAGQSTGELIACGGTCWQRANRPTLVDAGPFEDGVAWSPDGTQLAVRRDPTGFGSPPDFREELWIVDLATRQVRRVMDATHGDLGVSIWSPDGKWLIFAMAVGGVLNEGPGRLLHQDLGEIDVYSVRADGATDQTPRQLTQGLQPFSIGLYTPLTLPSAP